MMQREEPVAPPRSLNEIWTYVNSLDIKKWS